MNQAKLFSPEWEAEMLRLPKKELVKLLTGGLKRNAVLVAGLKAMNDVVTQCHIELKPGTIINFPINVPEMGG